MRILIDTSILGRLANRHDASHAVAQAAVAELHRRGDTLHITAQNLIEFRNFATRPIQVNGLGLLPSIAANLSTIFETSFPLLEENPSIYPTWRNLVDAVGVVGKQVHDARLVAVCHVHAVDGLLTFNVGHFSRLSSFAPGVLVIDPASV